MALKVGDRVMVRNQTIGGKDIDEGLATIEMLIQGNGRMVYAVRFDNEPNMTYQRFVADSQKVEE